MRVEPLLKPATSRSRRSTNSCRVAPAPKRATAGALQPGLLHQRRMAVAQQALLS